MISELIWFAVLFLLVCIALVWLAEKGTLEDYSEKRNVDKLADRSRGRKTPTARRACRYVSAGLRPGKAAWHG
ncbi:MAG: hypothetical protein IKH30_01585 [Clostridia bacterium]|nr:hypothetical protein [Clostridia bacterium]MBR4537234.1 hypothetical protein [Clostridia bacterium]MBR4540535.1 hypothetical protein [Clostridia bacterium]